MSQAPLPSVYQLSPDLRDPEPVRPPQFSVPPGCEIIRVEPRTVPRSDPVLYWQYKAHAVRELLVDAEICKLMHNDLLYCANKHGMNSQEKCRPLAVAYLKFITRFNGVDLL